MPTKAQFKVAEWSKALEFDHSSTDVASSNPVSGSVNNCI